MPPGKTGGKRGLPSGVTDKGLKFAVNYLQLLAMFS